MSDQSRVRLRSSGDVFGAAGGDGIVELRDNEGVWHDVSTAVREVRTDFVVGQLTTIDVRFKFADTEVEAYRLGDATQAAIAGALEAHGWAVRPPERLDDDAGRWQR